MELLISVVWQNALITFLIGFGIVLSILILLVYILKGFGAAFYDSKEKNDDVVANNIANKEQSTSNDTDEAAIAMAIHLYFAEAHDEESYVITIKDKTSAWNSKMYGLNNLVK